MPCDLSPSSEFGQPFLGVGSLFICRKILLFLPFVEVISSLIFFAAILILRIFHFLTNLSLYLTSYNYMFWIDVSHMGLEKRMRVWENCTSFRPWTLGRVVVRLYGPMRRRQPSYRRGCWPYDLWFIALLGENNDILERYEGCVQATFELCLQHWECSN